MHAVGDVADRILADRHVVPVIGAQLRRDTAVYPAHAIDAACAGERQARHVEAVPAIGPAPERDHAVGGQRGFAQVSAEGAVEQIVAEHVVAGGHRCVRREHALRRRGFERGVEIEPARESFAQQLEDQERGMAFIDMPHGGREPQRAQHAHAADAEDHLLADARRLAAAVQAVGDVAVFVRVLRAVGVEQVHRYAPDLRAPDARGHFALADAHLHGEPLAGGIVHRLDRQVAGIGVGILGVLHALAVDALREVALSVQQSDRNEIQALVAGRLAVVAGQDPQAPGVDREALVETVLGAEISHQRLVAARLDLDVVVEVVDDLRVALYIYGIARGALEPGLVYAAQHQPRVATHLLP